MKQIPKYMEIYLDVKRKIMDDRYQVGAKLPTGDQLAEEYGTSKLTVKKGIDLLVSEGVLRTRSGFGTEVLRKPIDNSKVFGPNEGLLSTVGEEHVDSEIHTFSIELPSKEVAEMLQISEKDYIYNIIRSRFIDHQPYSIEQTFMPLAVIPGLEPKHLKKSVYAYITDELNLEIKSSHLWIKGDVANEFDAKILNIEPGEFMIEVDKVVSLSSGVPFEYSLSRHIYKDFIFEAIFVEK
ncbi:GntR family transcriptional regulator [Candidatus Enterococcus courvalinii]|uniref:GntR family transcriptional regulator n=1 Tax=Candidatus Enterococcus courvalinii TaxID=2815329 RepID=A0ABS3HXF4_9ENTE|nr:GntR family transcriptional regulator [Enterococcus sp. MSG2901]MBO0481086.1 GntR family transcriptional regulator [Enterococcus sp. MSG2901]